MCFWHANKTGTTPLVVKSSFQLIQWVETCVLVSPSFSWRKVWCSRNIFVITLPIFAVGSSDWYKYSIPPELVIWISVLCTAHKADCRTVELPLPGHQTPVPGRGECCSGSACGCTRNQCCGKHSSPWVQGWTHRVSLDTPTTQKWNVTVLLWTYPIPFTEKTENA